MMKLNWGTLLMIGMGIFIAFIVTLCVVMFRSKTDALVDTNYYEKGIDYDTDYNRKEQVITDAAEPVITMGNTDMSIVFAAPAMGKIRFIRPADGNLDFLVDINTATGNEVLIPQQQLVKGIWRMQITWQSLGKSYLFEKEINAL